MFVKHFAREKMFAKDKWKIVVSVQEHHTKEFDITTHPRTVWEILKKDIRKHTNNNALAKLKPRAHCLMSVFCRS